LIREDLIQQGNRLDRYCRKKFVQSNLDSIAKFIFKTAGVAIC